MRDPLILKELCRYPIGTYADIIYRNALLHPEDEAFVSGDQRVTFSGYNERVNRLIQGLRAMGVSGRSVIGILSWNCMGYADVYGAAMKGGFIASPFNPRLNRAELEALINDSETNTLFVGPGLMETADALRPSLPRVEHVVSLQDSGEGDISLGDLLERHPSAEPSSSVQPDDPFLIFYTSGTTGAPKGALYTHRRKLDNVRIKVMEMGVRPSDRHLMVLPFFHIGGDSHVWPFFYMGGANVIMATRSFDPEAVLRLVEEERITDLQIVPTQLHGILSVSNLSAYDLSSLKRIYYAASPMPAELLKRGLEIFGPIFSQGYGQTESGPQITSLPRKAHQVLDRPDEEQKVLLSCGQPSIGVHARVVDSDGADVGPDTIGEIIARSESIMVGYWRKEEETGRSVKEGWLYTGDLGYYDHRGYLYIVDRKKDMIISGGENVYPREIEEVLYAHPDVVEAAVIGVPDPVWVERVVAVVVPRVKAEPSDEALIAFCKERLASYKAPKSVEFVDALPKNPQGKILKRKIRSMFGGEGLT